MDWLRAVIRREKRYHKDPIPLHWDGPTQAIHCCKISAWSMEKGFDSNLNLIELVVSIRIIVCLWWNCFGGFVCVDSCCDCWEFKIAPIEFWKNLDDFICEMNHKNNSNSMPNYYWSSELLIFKGERIRK